MNAAQSVVMLAVRDAETSPGRDPIDAAHFADAIYQCIDARWLELGGTLQSATLTLTKAGREALAKCESVSR